MSESNVTNAVINSHDAESPPVQRALAQPAPFLKWAGGKQKLLEQFEPFIPSSFSRYIEPFLGSGAVFFHLATSRPGLNAILCDNNQELIGTYEVVRDNPEELIARLEGLRASHDKTQYLRVRAQRPEGLSRIESAARFIYLNKTCFNGLYRVNSRGQFNVPMGNYMNPGIFDRDNLFAVSEVLKSATLKVAHFTECLSFCKPGDFIYLDSPYHPLSATSSFTSYTKDAFGEKEQAQLADVFQTLHNRGCLLMLSNSDTPLIRKLYDHQDFKIHSVWARRAINSNAEKRGPITEVLVTNV